MASPTRPSPDAALLADLIAFLETPKSLAAPVAWKPDGEALRFAAALDIEGVTEERFTLVGRARLDLPDRDVSLILRWARPDGRPMPFERLDWKPLSDHTNKADAPGPLRLLRIEGSQRHPLADNAALPRGLLAAMAENLPVAEPLVPEPADWPALAALASHLWRIDGLADAEAPPWQIATHPPGGRRRRPGRTP